MTRAAAAVPPVPPDLPLPRAAGTTTPLVLLVVWTIASAGFLVGYASGPNVADAPAFQRAFLARDRVGNRFVLANKGPQGRTWCITDAQRVSTFLWVKYVAGCASALPVGWITRVRGRRVSIWLGCFTYAVAHIVRAAAGSWAVLLLGQVLDGVSCAFLYQSPYIEAVEIAPHFPRTRRGAFVYSDQIGRSLGVWARSLLQQGLAMQPDSPAWGWRVVVIFPVWPALVVMMLVPWIPETPNSLMQRGQLQAARAALQEIRGPLVNVDEEFKSILAASDVTSHGSWFAQLRALLRVEQLPPLMLVFVLTCMRELSGGDFILLYSVPLQLGLGMDHPRTTFGLLQVGNALYVVAGVAGCLLIDSLGRRGTFIISAAGMAAFCALVAHTLAAADKYPGPIRLRDLALFHTGLLVSYTSYALGWAGGFWLLMAELFPLATRSLATSLFVGQTMLLYGVSSRFSLGLTCLLRWSLFWVFFGVNCAAILLFALLLPETKSVPLEAVHTCFERHWLWRHFYPRRPHGPHASGPSQAHAGPSAQHLGGTSHASSVSPLAWPAQLQQQGRPVSALAAMRVLGGSLRRGSPPAAPLEPAAAGADDARGAAAAAAAAPPGAQRAPAAGAAGPFARALQDGTLPSAASDAASELPPLPSLQREGGRTLAGQPSWGLGFRRYDTTSMSLDLDEYKYGTSPRPTWQPGGRRGRDRRSGSGGGGS